MTSDIRNIGIGESKTLTGTVIPKVVGVIANYAKAKITATSGNRDYLSNIESITIVEVVTELGNIKITLDNTARDWWYCKARYLQINNMNSNKRLCS